MTSKGRWFDVMTLKRRRVLTGTGQFLYGFKYDLFIKVLIPHPSIIKYTIRYFSMISFFTLQTKVLYFVGPRGQYNRDSKQTISLVQTNNLIG